MRAFPAARVNDIAQAFALAEELGLAPIKDVALEGGDTVPTVADPIGLSATPPAYALPPPTLGEHDDEIRGWLAEE